MPKRHTNAVFLGDLRARTAGKIIHFERIAADIASNIAEARRDLEAIDRIIRLFDDRIDPAAIRPIAAVKKIPRGSRGGLTLAIKAVLETAGTEGLLVREIAWALQLKYGLIFETPEESERFFRNSLKRRCHEMVQMGMLKAVPEEHPGTIGSQMLNRYWLASLAPSSLDSLVARAEAQGMAVREVDAEATAEG